jgi:hypothetical protein
MPFKNKKIFSQPYLLYCFYAKKIFISLLMAIGLGCGHKNNNKIYQPLHPKPTIMSS